MAKIVTGDRVAKQARLRIGCTAAIFNPTRDKILLTRRSDNGLWCLPGGGMDAGETAAECCEREVWEETGLMVKAKRLIGIYTTPHVLVEYRDGTKAQIVAMLFEVEIIGGQAGLSNEVTEYGYFNADESAKLELMYHHRERVADIFAQREAAFIK